MNILKLLIFIITLNLITIHSISQSNVIDEVVAIVGDEPILKSDIEQQYQQALMEGVVYDGDIKCRILEDQLIQKLMLNQAILDSVEVSENEVINEVDRRMNYFINQIGSKEKLEEYYNKSLIQIKRDQMDMIRNMMLTQRMQQNITSDLKITPAEVRIFFKQTPVDSLPMVPVQYELQQVAIYPPIKQEEIDNVKNRLRNFQKQVNEGRDFATLAVLYSEDKGSATRGGDLGFATRSTFVPEFANVAFNLQEKNKVSKIVETEYGFHIIQLIDRKGDRINVRHILLKPKINNEDREKAKNFIDSISQIIQNNTITFDEAALKYSMDKDSRANGGLMVNPNNSSSKFELNDMEPEIIRAVQNLNENQISAPVLMKDTKGYDVYRIFKLKKKTDTHRANLTDDYQLLKNIMLAKKREKIINDWIIEKQTATYISIKNDWINCDFKYSGWVK
ncbi:MAG: peptidylprolyl isomerase [Marinilabiliaceae bacterium]|nr:peptidylprolyl isomerase [Marinilabiliaceae bacterium]